MDKPQSSLIDELLTANSAFLLAALGAESRRLFNAAVEQWGIGWPGQTVLTALHALSRFGPMYQKQVADFAGIDPRNLGPVIDGLENSGLVERQTSRDDRRIYQLQLTAQGRAKAKQIQSVRSKIEQNMTGCLSDKERESLHRLLMKVWENSEVSEGFRSWIK